MGYIISLFVGALIGFILSAILSTNKNSEDIQYAYIKGIEDGKRNNKKYN